MDSYDYMKSLLPVPSHSVPLNPMSGGGTPLPTIPEGNDETKNINNANNEFPEPPDASINQSTAKSSTVPTNNLTQFPEGEENVFGVFDFSKNDTTLAISPAPPISIKEFNIGGDIYYITEVDDVTKINLGDEKVKTLIKDFHLELLDEVKQKEFIFSLLKCSDLNSIVQGPVCDPLIENISYLITKINQEYSGVVEVPEVIADKEATSATNPATENLKRNVEVAPEESKERKEIGTVEIRKFKNLCNVEGDGWCLYRSLLLAKYLLDTDSDDCGTDAAKKIINENDDIIRIEIERIVQYIRTEIVNGTQIGTYFIETIPLLISNVNKQEDVDANYYKDWNVTDVSGYLNAMSIIKENGEKFFGDVQIAGLAFALINKVSLDVYEDAYIIKDAVDASGNKKSIKVRTDGENYRKSITSADLFKTLGEPVPKNTLHIYHSGRIHFKVLVTKRSLNARLKNNNSSSIKVSVAPTEPPQFPSNSTAAVTTQNTPTNIRNAFKIGLNKSVTTFTNSNPATTTISNNPFNGNIPTPPSGQQNPFNKFN
jgi:hypothetical protein